MTARGGGFFALCSARMLEKGFLRQNKMPRRLRAIEKRKRKRVESLQQGEGEGGWGESDYAPIGLDGIRQVKIPKGSRCDATKGNGCLGVFRKWTRAHIRLGAIGLSVVSAYSLAHSTRGWFESSILVGWKDNGNGD
jgi:hypothetical protein